MKHGFNTSELTEKLLKYYGFDRCVGSDLDPRLRTYLGQGYLIAVAKVSGKRRLIPVIYDRDDTAALDDIAKLRYHVMAERLRVLKTRPARREIESFDFHAQHATIL